MEINRFKIELNGNQWILMELNGNQWILMELNGKYMEINGF